MEIKEVLDFMLARITIGDVIICVLLFCITFGVPVLYYRSSVKQAKEKVNRCTMEIWADVLSVTQRVNETTRSSIDKHRGKYRRVIYYMPTLRFNFNSEVIEKVCHRTNRNKGKYIVGEKVKIFVDPNDVNNMYYDNVDLELLLRRYKKIFWWVFAVVCFIWCVFIGFYFWESINILNNPYLYMGI